MSLVIHPIGQHILVLSMYIQLTKSYGKKHDQAACIL